MAHFLRTFVFSILFYSVFYSILCTMHILVYLSSGVWFDFALFRKPWHEFSCTLAWSKNIIDFGQKEKSPIFTKSDQKNSTICTTSTIQHKKKVILPKIFLHIFVIPPKK